MLKIVRNSPTVGFIVPILNKYFGPDELEYKTKTEQLANRSVIKEETGWDRIRKMLYVDDLGNISHELNTIIQSACMSSIFGMFWGGVIHSKDAYTNFIRNNEATTFQSHLDAKRQLQTAVTTAFGQGAFKWAWRLSLFTTSFVTICTTLQVYRGTYGISEYVIAGGVTGALYKFNMGPKGWIVGCCLGCAMGAIGGATTMGLLKISGISMEETRYWQYQWRQGRREGIRQVIAQDVENKDFAIIKLHDLEVGEAGKDIKNLNDGSETK